MLQKRHGIGMASVRLVLVASSSRPSPLTVVRTYSPITMGRSFAQTPSAGLPGVGSLLAPDAALLRRPFLAQRVTFAVARALPVGLVRVGHSAVGDSTMTGRKPGTYFA